MLQHAAEGKITTSNSGFYSNPTLIFLQSNDCFTELTKTVMSSKFYAGMLCTHTMSGLHGYYETPVQQGDMSKIYKKICLPHSIFLEAVSLMKSVCFPCSPRIFNNPVYFPRNSRCNKKRVTDFVRRYRREPSRGHYTT